MQKLKAATVGVLLLTAPLISSADTMGDLRAQLEVLMSQLSALQLQVSAAPAPKAMASCPALGRSLARGSTGEDVTAFQKFLISTNYMVAEHASGYFGILTESSVKQFQCQKNIACSGSGATTGWGVVGAHTRAALMQVCVGSTLGTQQQSLMPASCPMLPTPAATCATGWLANTDAKGCTISYRCSFPIGQLSPTFVETAPGAPDASSCVWEGRIIPNGSSITAYQAPSVPNNVQCASEQRVCTNGTLSGGYRYPSCFVSSAASCSFNNQQVGNGSSVMAYKNSSIAPGSMCESEYRTCSGGSLSGSYLYSACSTAASPSCTFNGSIVQNGGSRIAYQTSSVPYGSQCVSETRTCSNATLSGSYTAASCAVATGNTCNFDGKSLASGSSVAAFQSRSALAGGTCVSQTRTCTNGTLSGNSAYAYSTCSALFGNAPPPTTFVSQTYNGVGIQLHAWFTTPGGQGPFPTIILAHGCNGVNPDDSNSAWNQMSTWASLFRQWGFATLVLDSFTARGVPGGICSGGSDSIRPSTRALDIYFAATALSQTTGVSPRKIGVFGVSHGAAAAGLVLADDRYTSEAEAALATAGGKIAAGAALYPECETALYGPKFHAPLFVAAGSADDWSSPLKCQTLTNFPTVSGTPVDFTNSGSLVRVIVYPGVTHAFDIPGPTQVVVNRYGYHIAYNPAVTADVQARIRAFFDSYIR